MVFCLFFNLKKKFLDANRNPKSPSFAIRNHLLHTMVEKTVEIITQEAPTLFFVEVDFVENMRSIIVTRWNGFNTPLHTLAHALNSHSLYLW
jgi:hypothetical protein